MAVDTALRPAETEALTTGLIPAVDRRLGPVRLAEQDATTPAVYRDAIFRRALVAADGLVTVLMLAALFGGNLRPVALLLPVALILVAKTMNLYDRDEVVVCKRTLDDAPAIFHLATLFALGTWLAQAQLSSATIGA